MKGIISAPNGHFGKPGNPGEPSTYCVPPPTALEGLINSCYWKPGHTVQIKSITLLNEIMYATESITHLNHQTGVPWLRTFELVVNPKYLIDFWLVCRPGIDPNKRIGQLSRRLMKGQHFSQPYMGISDYPATVELLPKDAEVPAPIDIKEMDLGQMPHYWIWKPTNIISKKPFVRKTSMLQPDRSLKRVTGEAVMFNAKIINGVVKIPAYPRLGENGYAN